MDHRRLRATGSRVLAAVCGTLLLAACANDADVYPHGEESESFTNGSVVRTVLLYVVIPAAILLAIGLLAWLPVMLRSKRYRPREGWQADPVWFAGPADPVSAVQEAQTGDVTRGGSGGSW